LLIGDGDTSSISVNTGEVLVVTEAAQEGTIDVGSGGIVLAANTIENVLAVIGGASTCGVASLEAKDSSTHKVVPFDGLDVLGASGGTERLGEQEGTERVTTLISTVGIELSSGITSGNVDEGLVDVASDLNVVGCLQELDTSESALGDDTSTVAWLRAPCDTLTLDVTDEGVWLGGTPEAEVINAVDNGGLAQRGGTFGGAVADVVAGLGTTFTISGICLIWQSGVGEVL
jgi:hypothetical protein